MIGFLLWNEAQNKFSAEWGANVEIPHIVGYLAASLFVAAAGLIASGLVVLGRVRAFPQRGPADTTAAADQGEAAVDTGTAEGDLPAPRALHLSLAPGWL